MPASDHRKLKRALCRWLSGKLPTCKRMASLMSGSLERRLNWRERLRLKFHLRSCALCLRYLEQLRLLRATLRRRQLRAGSAQTPALDASVNAASLSAHARARLKRALARERR